MIEQLPELVQNYLLFCNYRQDAIDKSSIDLKLCTWLYPTTLLPLAIFMKKQTISKYIEPDDQNVKNYINLILGLFGEGISITKSYIPCVPLPKEKNKAEKILEQIYRLNNKGKQFGGENAFKYLIGELVDNVYEHSRFENGVVMAQRYDKKGFVEICFFDDGITIGGSFREKGMIFEDHIAIVEAVNGLSTKSQERGFGLSTNLNMFTKGIAGEVLVLSGLGAIYTGKEGQKLYKLQKQHELRGTLITIRVPYPCSKVNIYDYIN